ncbi:MAG: trypsin-like peptidase domain-containing protein [Lachnospiraceae bacterium]|nr:trypsin-like peptidase domain-containing protein [Lachnospiraceae bacterium]
MKKVRLFAKAVFAVICLVFAASFMIKPINVQAAGKLSVSDKKVWINGTGSITLTYKDHTNETVKIGKASKKYVSAKVGKWKGDKVTIKLEALADKDIKFTVTVGGEKVTVRLYLRTLRESSAEDIYLYLKDAMVEIKCTDSTGSVYIGSGFFVGNGRVLTNEHVVDSASDIEITDYYGTKYPIENILGISKEKDLLLLKVKEGNKGALSIADEVHAGERIYNMGSPAGITGTFVTGLVAHEGYEIEKAHYIQFSMPTGIGAGGGPIVNAKGQVLGVMTLVVNSAQNITMAVDFTEISQFIKKLSSDDLMSMEDFYKTTEGKTKVSNDYQIFNGLSDENTTRTYSGLKDELSREELYKLAYDACVDISVYYDSFGNGGSGSGFFISEDTIITNQHVVSNKEAVQITIKDYYGNEYELKGGINSIKADPGYDVAILTVTPKEEGVKHGILDTASGYVPAVGETVYGMGSPAGYRCTFSEGIVIMSTRKFIDGDVEMDFINMSVPITGGSSGGPLINKYGQVIGINSRIINVTGNSNLAVPIKYVSVVAKQ